ncbi:hypothetical protein LSTR_LSTR010545 [Laodelphax striatellus]|uniref:PDZ domain-containing protein n=1 Tax=Laodelphax striatellus TaxID=195883 RepID=A0A482WL08_LAOST|nr:hypothetical protein LSTR_LSTR010545 [Laodelphax striatellus]
MLQWSETQQSTVVACIESNGPAERCGCLRVGDRVVKVNDSPPPICAEPRRLEQLLHGSSAILSVQFDIAQSVVPATGIFTVKLANNKNCGLGITMTSCNHGMVISQIRAGSVAHRSGTLFPGDRILAVNSCSLELLSLDEAVDLLQSAPDIVTLTIQKEVQAEPSVVYTVELERNGGPLGITIAGSEDCCEPIVISALTPSGLAEKTGALHIGDRLLAIDGQSIEKQPLSQAIALLQHSGDNVVLKVARSSQRMGPGYSSPGLPSVDSAVESWDSSQSPSTNQNCPSFYKTDEPLRDPPKPVWEKIEPSHQTCNSLDIHSASDVEDCSSYRLSESVISELQAQLNNNNNQNKNNVQLPSPPCPLQVNYQHRNNTLPAHRRRSSTLGMQGSVELMNIDHSQKSFQSTVDNEVCASSKAMPEITFETFLNRGKCQRVSDIESLIRGNDIFQVTLFKDPVYEDYGFSVSDGLYERGGFINRIRHGGPADNSRMLCPFDRILQVNDTRTDDFDCCLTVPLVAAAGDRLTLVVSRPSADNKDNSEGLPWVEEELEDSLNGSEIRSPTITKTL